MTERACISAIHFSAIAMSISLFTGLLRGSDFATTGVRALVAGVASYLAGWVLSMAYFRVTLVRSKRPATGAALESKDDDESAQK